MKCGCKIHYGAGKGGNRIVYCQLHESAPKLLAALKESTYWLVGTGKTAAESGCTCDFLSEAEEMIYSAISAAEAVDA